MSTNNYGALELKHCLTPPSPRLTWRFNCGILCHGVALLVLFTSIIVNYWVTGVAMGRSLNIGLWRACLDGICVSLFDYDSELQNALGYGMVWVQIFAILALVIAILSFGCGLFCLIFSGMSHRDKQLPGLSILVLISGALTSLSTFIFYVSVYRHLLSMGNTEHIHTATVGWLISSSLLNILAAVLYVMEHTWRCSGNSQYEYVPLKQ